MAHLEIRRGLRRLDFTPKTDPRPHDCGTHVVVEFEVSGQLAHDQIVLINLGLHDGFARELKGRPTLVTTAHVKPPAFVYRLEGDVA